MEKALDPVKANILNSYMCQALWATQWVKPIYCSQEADTESRPWKMRLLYITHQMISCRSKEPEALRSWSWLSLILVMLLTVLLGGQ